MHIIPVTLLCAPAGVWESFEYFLYLYKVLVTKIDTRNEIDIIQSERGYFAYVVEVQYVLFRNCCVHTKSICFEQNLYFRFPSINYITLFFDFLITVQPLLAI